jgi:hypothetical protein
MRRARRVRLVAATALASVIAGVALAGVKVQIDYRPGFDFSTLRTWAWHPTNPGSAAMIVTETDDSAAFKRQLEPRLLPAIESGFASRGFPIATSAEPDFYVTYYVFVTVGSTEQYLGQFANLSKWGLPPMSPQTQSLTVYPQGSLILDVTSRLTNEVVWRGVARAELKWNESQEKRDQRIRQAVEELVKRFPPKAAKTR